MVIHKIKIIQFGKIKDLEIKFQEGINQICSENGSGKTTIMNFFRAMFYGMGRNQKKIDDSLRSKSIPWNSNFCSGMMEFEENGTHYRLERYFGKTAKEDQMTLFEEKSGQPLQINQEIGEFFLHMQEEEFLNTLFMNQKELLVRANIQLQDTLINVMQTGNVATSYERAFENLKKIEKETSLRKESSKASIAYKEKKKNQDELEELYQENSQVLTWLDENKKICAEIEKENEQLQFYQEIEKYFQTKELYALNQHYIQLKEKYERWKNEKEDLEDYDALLNKAQQYMAIPSDIKNFGFEIIVMILLFIVSLTISFLFSFYWLFLLLGEVPIFLYLMKQRKKDKEMKKEKKEACIAFFKQYNCNNFQEFTSYISLQKTKQKLHQQNRSCEVEYFNFIHEYASFIEQMPILFQYDEEKEKVFDYKEKIVSLQNQIKENEKKHATNLGKMVSFEKNTLEIQEKEILKQEYEEKIKKYAIINQSSLFAMEILKETKEELEVDYIPLLKQKFLTILNTLSDVHFDDLAIDNQFNVLLAEKEFLHEIDYYSQGYKDLIYFSLRIALLEVGFSNYQVPLFLDDPFVNLDKNHVKKVKMFLKEYAKERQLFYFHCNNHDNFS